MPRSPLARGLAFLLALLHLVVLPLAAVADAHFERDTVSPGHATVHLESRDAARAARVHPTDCALCQLVAAVAAPLRAEGTAPAAVAALVPPLAGEPAHDATGRHSLALPRAPPAS